MTRRFRIVAIVQARMSSTRLPGKVLLPLAGAPALQRIVERVRHAGLVRDVCVATSEDGSDDAVASLCGAAEIDCVRGSLPDVLSRYQKAAAHMKADVVVRITGDCPLIDPIIIDDVVSVFLRERTHVSYASNVDERTFPDGLDVEVFSRQALEDAAEMATDVFEREHVTPYLRRHMRKISCVQDVNLSALRWTLDHADDYDAIAAVYASLYDQNPLFLSDDVYAHLLKHPELIRVGDRHVLDSAERKFWVKQIRRHLLV